MSKRLYQLVLIISVINVAQATFMGSHKADNNEPNPPEEIQYLLEKSKECTFWISEWDSTLDADYKAVVEKNVNTICLEVIDERTRFLDKYKNDPKTLEYLN